jgi:hypothetical protein
VGKPSVSAVNSPAASVVLSSPPSEAAPDEDRSELGETWVSVLKAVLNDCILIAVVKVHPSTSFSALSTYTFVRQLYPSTIIHFHNIPTSRRWVK